MIEIHLDALLVSMGIAYVIVDFIKIFLDMRNGRL